MGSVVRPNSAASPFKVLVVGGSYAGLATALNLSDLCQGRDARGGWGVENPCKTIIHTDITIVDERDGFYNVIGSPLVFASTDYAKKAWVPYGDVPALQDASHIQMVQGSVTNIDLAAKKAMVKQANSSVPVTFDYDFVVVASGLRRIFPVVPQSLDKDSYLAEITPHVQAVSSAQNGVLVVGGGAVGLEMAAELKFAQPQVKVTLAHSRARLLSSEPLDEVVGAKVLEMLQEQGIEVLLEHRLQETRPVAGQPAVKEVVFSNGQTLRVNNVIMALSNNRPTTTFLPTEAVNEDGYVKIQPSLFFPETVPNADSALAAGDTVAWSGVKRFGRAIHQAHYAACNIHQRMQQILFDKTPEYLILDPVPPMIGIAVGSDAISYINGGELESGKAVVENFFGDDLGLSICWKYLGLEKTSKDFKGEAKKE
ncbi:pyridine nucleotide-disulfide oxidoreductase [Grosmannia clavigera kw1407]|uniref:Pyridine nucleotide-disulfide oxidoreductase n=1 Tax=Grosmannia clavigera (strain kw1407 / UAMH 11150) TaxID=655863 RepID=F0XFP8_GROCL|nr:pyridine nucleotide-disulfide oxidoreductase [Grosmannia clavigera kw1407]EFX03678.1 pyridine nucleotide-disulfide oxidoreductase [Grosmannia clavigera kw1407]